MKQNPSNEYQNKIATYMESHWRFHNHLDHERHQKRIIYTASFLLPDTCIEIGSANGYSTNLIQETRKDCLLYGVEPTDWGYNEACKNYPNIRFFKAFAENLPFADKQFDTVLLPEVIEHCEDPKNVLDECLRITKKRLIVTHPVNIAGMKNDPTHLRYFDFLGMGAQINISILFTNEKVNSVQYAGLDKQGNVVDDALNNEDKVFFGITIVDKIC